MRNVLTHGHWNWRQLLPGYRHNLDRSGYHIQGLNRTFMTTVMLKLSGLSILPGNRGDVLLHRKQQKTAMSNIETPSTP